VARTEAAPHVETAVKRRSVSQKIVGTLGHAKEKAKAAFHAVTHGHERHSKITDAAEKMAAAAHKTADTKVMYNVQLG
jgi:hypothetical protein